MRGPVVPVALEYRLQPVEPSPAGTASERSRDAVPPVFGELLQCSVSSRLEVADKLRPDRVCSGEMINPLASRTGRQIFCCLLSVACFESAGCRDNG